MSLTVPPGSIADTLGNRGFTHDLLADLGSSHSLFIKFNVHERELDVLLAEPYIIPQAVVSQ